MPRADPPPPPEMTEAEFCARFLARMIARGAGQVSDGSSIEDYAREAAPAYWADPDCRDDPEACADEDMECWSDDA